MLHQNLGKTLTNLMALGISTVKEYIQLLNVKFVRLKFDMFKPDSITVTIALNNSPCGNTMRAFDDDATLVLASHLLMASCAGQTFLGRLLLLHNS